MTAERRTESEDALRAPTTEAGDRLLTHNAGRDPTTLEWLTNDIRAIEQEAFDKGRAARPSAVAALGKIRDLIEAPSDPETSDRDVIARIALIAEDALGGG